MSCEPQLRRAGAVAVVVDAGAADRAELLDQLLVQRHAAAADHAALAHPLRALALVDDARPALGELRGQARLPHRRRHRRQIEVVVAGVDGVGHRVDAVGVAGGRLVEDDGLGLEEGHEPFLAALAADARLLEPAERDAEVGAERVVPTVPGAELAGHGTGAVGVGGEHRGVEAVDRVVGDADRVVLVGGGDHAEHRTEDLLLRDRRRVVDVAEHRRLDEPAAVEVLRTPAAGGERRAFVDALRDVALDAVALALRRRADPSGSARRTGRRRAPCRSSSASASTISSWRVARDDDARERRAHLPGQHALRLGERLRRGLRCRRRRGSPRPTCRRARACMRAMRSPQIAPILRPAAVEPVKVILSTRGSRTSSSDTSRSAVTTLSTPGGSPISSATSATT